MSADVRHFPKPPAWFDRAACADTYYDLDFFPRYAADDISDVVAFCRNCPVRATCEQYAIDNGERDGIWGARDFTVREVKKPKKEAS